MHSGVSISLVIPCYNEAQGIAQVIQAIPDYVDEIVVVDNNSTDNTAQVAQDNGAKVASQPEKGYGNALRAGFLAATQDVIVTMDGDGTYPAEQIDQIVAHLQSEQLDFISCSRFPLSNPQAMSKRNQFGNQVLNKIFGALYGYWLKDSQSGMWCFRRRVLPLMDFEGTSWEFSSEIKIEAATNPYIRFEEMPINFHPRIGFSHFHSWKAAIAVGIRDINFLIAQKRINRKKRQQAAYEKLSQSEQQALTQYPPAQKELQKS